jgi:capsid assembly protease
MSDRSAAAFPDRVLAWALDHPWAITRPMLSIVAHVLGRRLVGKTPAEDPAAIAPRLIPEPPPAGPAHGVAVLPIHGVLAPRMNLMSDISGGATFEGATHEIERAVADPAIGTIVLDWDSPGGSCAGATEFAAVLLAARARKRIVSIANHQMCSAAYWTGACVSEVVATPSALVGSIGVYCLHEDLSEYLANEGIKLRYISAGRYKVDGNPAEPLSTTAEARLQAIVDSSMSAFVSDVATGRGVSPDKVRSGMGEGAVLTATEALAAGLIDRIETLDALVARVASTPLPAPAARRALAARDLSIGRELAALGFGHN